LGHWGNRTAFLASRLHLAVIRLTVGPVSLEADRPVKAIRRRSVGLPGVRCSGRTAGERHGVLGRRNSVGRLVKRISIPFEFRAALMAVLIASLISGAVLGSAALMRAGIERERIATAAANKGALPVVLSPIVAQGAKLFSLNCAQCHADDATGDEGPDLHGLAKSDERIKAIITNGIKGEMPSFRKKLQEPEKEALVGFLRSLK
jgi:mono/diheme cytochrome c family protein